MVLLAFTVGCGGRADPDLSDAASASSDAGSSGGGPTDSAATTERSTSDAEAGSGAGEADASNDSDSAAEDAGGFDADCFRDAQGVRGQCCATQADCEPGAPPWLYCCSSMAHLCVYCGPM
jgi:hypothetical protein